MHRYIKFGFILILILFIAFSDIHISYASTSPMDVSDNTTHVRLQTIINSLTNIYSRQATTNTYLQNIINKMTGVTGDTYQSWNIHQLLSRIATNTNSISNSAALTDQKVEQIYYSVDGLESTLSSIDNKTKDYTLYIDNLESINSDINWIQETITYGYYDSLNNAVSKSSPLSQGSYKDIYIRLDFSTPYWNKALKIIFGVIPYSPLDKLHSNAYISEFWTINNSNNGAVQLSDNHYNFYYSSSTQSSSFYLDGNGRTLSSGGVNSALSSLIIHITGERNSYVFVSSPCLAYSLSFDSEDYYKIANYLKLQEIDLNPIQTILNKFEELYASDDLIAAKQNQQNFEDQAISNFTGSGSAASSTSDINSLKGVSSTLKDGINTGGSVNNALSVFSNYNSIWDWFKQDNYNNINNQYNPNSNRLLRSNSRSDDIIDFYSQNQSEVFKSLGD